VREVRPELGDGSEVTSGGSLCVHRQQSRLTLTLGPSLNHGPIGTERVRVSGGQRTARAVKPTQTCSGARNARPLLVSVRARVRRPAAV